MNYIILLLSCVLLFSCSTIKKTLSGNEGDGSLEDAAINLKVHKTEFPNGLKLLVVENSKLPIFSYYTFFDVGARYETEGMTGSTHLLEHLMFKGAKKYGPGQFDSIIEAGGGNTNAYTTQDETVYYQKAPISMLEKIIDLEADRMVNLLLEPDSFEKERSVVLEERKYRLENNPKGMLYHHMMKEVFTGTPYGTSVIGKEEDLKSVTREQVQNYFKSFYAPNNAIIVVVGDVKADQVKELIGKYYGNIPAFSELKGLKEGKDQRDLYKHQSSYKRSVRIHGMNPNPIFMLTYKGVPLGEKQAYVMDILASILGDGNSSYLYQKFVKSKNPLLTNIYASNYNLKHNGAFMIGGELLKKSNLNTVKSSLLREAKEICEKGISERGVQKTKNQYLVQLYNQLEDNSGVAGFIGARELYFGNFEMYKDELEIYSGITKDDVLGVCNNIFNENDYIFVSVWDKHPKR